ncbi:signal recognition particle-docking protein FtsY [Alteromonas genovensis]|uniref:Signal recognition particle receptor FtsY n=1 Tax=Alteromonas genovensis TaxID=471225 RepID=A0A6N9TKV2_9ALTE|nr:signal recognition particle-docking protein FtsY [Alteromonas genovensis]NDW16149.1 signal recognition particle-docking protein FtsY [Alteromonas genovensis]
MSKLFGWFSKNKKAEKQKEQQAKEQAAQEAANPVADKKEVERSEVESSEVESTEVDAAKVETAETEKVEAVGENPLDDKSSEKPAETIATQTTANVEQQEAASQITPTATDGNEAIHNTVVDAVESEEKQPLDFSSDKAGASVSKSVDEAATPLDDASAASVEAEVLAEEKALQKADASIVDTSSSEAQTSDSLTSEALADTAAEINADASSTTSTEATAEANTSVSAEEEAIDGEHGEAELEPQVKGTPQAKEKKSLFARLKESLSRTKENLGSGIVSLFKGKAIDDELYEDLETQLLVADVGMDTTQKIINHLTDSASRKDLKDAEALLDILKQQMSGMLANVNVPLSDALQKHNADEGPFVILMVGVNGVGKTTTIGKLAKQFQQQGKKVMLAAGDTFRAAAVEQLQVWGERNNIPVIAQHTGADSASVLYDALEAAKSRGSDILIADTAGRLQNKDNLMEELKKVVRVMKKLNPNAPHEVMLTLDAGTGQNAISQAKLFNEAVGLTGITLTKLDGTAKGGVIFSVADQFGIPIRYIGVGESIDDLRQFDGEEFIDALFSELDTPAS